MNAEGDFVEYVEKVNKVNLIEACNKWDQSWWYAFKESNDIYHNEVEGIPWLVNVYQKPMLENAIFFYYFTTRGV